MPSPRFGFFYNATGNRSPVMPLGGGSKGSSVSNYSLYVRVKDIILDSNHKKFKEMGEWNSIGTIFYENVKNPVFSSKIPNNFALPLFPNIKQYPLINEIVTILFLASSEVSDNTVAITPYYLPPVNIWNSQIHNAIPSSDVLPDEQRKDYQQVSAGSVRRVSDQSTEINLGKTFKETNLFNIHPLLPYEGDIIYEGRFGNSIRLGSTVNDASIPNPWSTENENGNPITIIRNGQMDDIVAVDESTNSWVPVLEDINNDKSSIYLTTTQNIPLFPASNIQDSFAKDTAPDEVSTYNKPQIILNSGRLVLNAVSDSTLIKSSQYIHLTADKSIHIDGSDKIVLSSPRVYLGSINGEEGKDGRIKSLVLGENLVSILEDISLFLSTLSVAFRTATDSLGAPIVSLKVIAADAESLNKTIKQKCEELLSDNVKTI